jgi:hypothetical protein
VLSTTRLFNPLTGTELKEILEKEFHQKLEGCELLAPHLTFPRLTYKVELYLEAYPMDYPVTLRAGRTIGDPEHEGPKTEQKLVYSREIGETQETAPDKVREDNQIPTLRVEKDPNTGQLTDVKQPVKKTSISVGAGTRPRSAKKASIPEEPVIVEVDVDPEPENQLDDTGNQVKLNRF